MPQLTALLPPLLIDRFRSFWGWWSAELAGLVPDAARRLRRAVPRAEIRAGREDIVIDREIGEVGERLGETRGLEALDEAGWEELAGLIDGVRATMILSPPDVFVTQIHLPTAARGRLRSAVGLQLRQIAPVEPARLVWNCRVVGGDRREIHVLVAMARADRVAEIRGLFEARSIPAPPIVARFDEEDLVLAPGADGSLTPAKRRLRRAFSIAAALLASVPLTTWSAASLLAWSAERRAETLHQALAPRLAEDRARVGEEGVRKALKAVLELPSASSLIEGLALGLPDSAFAVSAERHYDGRFAFAASTEDRDALEGALAQSPMLSAVHPSDMAPAEDGRLQLSFAGSPR